MEISITPIQTLHDVNKNQTQFNIKTHVQASGDFLYDLVTQQDIDEDRIQLKSSANGYASATATSKNGGSYFLVLKSKGTQPLQGKMWQDVLTTEASPEKPTKRKNLSMVFWVLAIVIVIIITQRNKK